MIRTRLLAVAAALALLAGCGAHKDAAADDATSQAEAGDNVTMEDVPSDSLAAPADTPLDSESNGVGSASGGNAQ